MLKSTSALLFFLFSISSIHAQWTLSPRPTNDILFDIEFTSRDTGYAGTEFGDIYQTVDSGATWQFLYKADSLGLFALHFIDSQNGYIGGGLDKGRIFKTTDAGQNWSVTTLPNINFLTDIFFPTDSVGYVSAYNSGVWTGMDGAVYKTNDAGQSWYNLNLATSLKFRSLFFLTADTGYVLGDFNTILKTTDGGLNWTSHTHNLNSAPSDCYFTSVDTGYVVGSLGHIVKTTNGGDTWSQVYAANPLMLFAIHFLNTDTGYAVGNEGLILKTLDAGATWATDTFGNFNSPGGYGWFGISSFDDKVYLSGANGKVARAGCITEIGYDSIVSCEPITWRDGFTYNQNDYSATITLSNAGQNGCDSLVSLKYTNIGVKNNGINVHRDSLYANISGATYQWIDCATGNVPILGATQRSFRRTVQGSYAVIISQNGCSDTSRCISSEQVGLKSEAADNLSIYPNPARDFFYLEFGYERLDLILIYNQLGQEIYREEDVGPGPYPISLAPGVYSVKLSNSERIKVIRLLVE